MSISDYDDAEATAEAADEAAKEQADEAAKEAARRGLGLAGCRPV
jgi:hypothetical protein